MTLRPLAHLIRPPKPREIARLHQLLRGSLRIHCGPAFEEPPQFEVLVEGRPSAEQLDASDRLKVVVVPWAGIPDETRTLLAARPHLALHNLHHNAEPTAEHAVALLLAAAKRLVPADQELRRGDWAHRYDRVRGESLTLSGKTAVVLGLGAIGRRVARSLRALGMTVVGIRRQAHGRDDPDADEVHGCEALAEVLPRAQALVVCLPSTPATAGLVGAEAIARLPQDALLVNVARGPVIDEGALYQALRGGQLFGAGLDVWWRYPEDEAARSSTLPAEHPFHELERVVLSPHRAGRSTDAELRRMEHLARLLLAYARGEQLPNRVDPARGY